MKKIFTFIAAALLSVTTFAETSTVLYEHPVGDPALAINWNDTSVANIAKAQLNSAQVGDYIQVTVQENGTSGWPSACITSKVTWNNMSGTCSFSMTKNSGSNYVFRYGLTYSGLRQIQQYNSYVNGAGFNLLKIELISMESTADLSHTIWFGNVACNWSGILLVASNFAAEGELAGAAIGDTLRVHHSSLGAEPKMALVNATGNYDVITGCEYKNVAGDYTDYILTQDILDVVEANHFQISANDLTLTQVELLAAIENDPDWQETTVWSSEIPMAISWDNSTWTGTYFDTFNNANAIVPTLKEGNVIRAYISSIAAWQTPQFSVQYKDGTDWDQWKDLTYKAAHGILSVTIPSDAVGTLLHDRGIVISGIYYYINRVAIYAPKGGTTAIETPSLVGEGRGEAAKILRNGQLFIIRDDKTYTLQGQLIK